MFICRNSEWMRHWRKLGTPGPEQDSQNRYFCIFIGFYSRTISTAAFQSRRTIKLSC